MSSMCLTYMFVFQKKWYMEIINNISEKREKQNPLPSFLNIVFPNRKIKIILNFKVSRLLCHGT